VSPVHPAADPRIATHQHISRGLHGQVDEVVNRAQTLVAGNHRGLSSWRNLRADVAAREKRIAKLNVEVVKNDILIAQGMKPVD
jgi:hypothetical protein